MGRGGGEGVSKMIDCQLSAFSSKLLFLPFSLKGFVKKHLLLRLNDNIHFFTLRCFFVSSER